jgi:hypothetical protein
MKIAIRISKSSSAHERFEQWSRPMFDSIRVILKSIKPADLYLDVKHFITEEEARSIQRMFAARKYKILKSMNNPGYVQVPSREGPDQGLVIDYRNVEDTGVCYIMFYDKSID